MLYSLGFAQLEISNDARVVIPSKIPNFSRAVTRARRNRPQSESILPLPLGFVLVPWPTDFYTKALIFHAQLHARRSPQHTDAKKKRLRGAKCPQPLGA